MVKIGVPLKYGHLADGRCNLYMVERVRRTLQKAGAFIIPIIPVQDGDYCDTKYDQFNELTDEDKRVIDDYLNMVDGVFFSGGHKITPYDRYLLEECIKRDIPTLGVCLGMQMMSCYKEDYITLEKIDSSINHHQDEDYGFTHKVSINKDSKLYDILGKEEVLVNSFHKFHVLENDIYDTVAFSEDGYIEGIELKNKKFNIGVQWHPEISYEFDDDSKKIIDYFINICKEK